MKTNKQTKQDFKSVTRILEGQLSINSYLAKTRSKRCDLCGMVSEKLVDIPQLDSETYSGGKYCKFCLSQTERIGVEL